MSDINRNKRVLWLCNHNTLLDFEVPLLISLGYEVFVPKLLPLEEMSFSVKITYEYDRNLTIDVDDMNMLNSFDFYGDVYNNRIINLINYYFGSAFVVFIENPLKVFSEYFAGNLYYRVFGLAGKYSYSMIMNELNLRPSKQSFFAESYPFLHEIESGKFSSDAKYLPLGMKMEKYMPYKDINFEQKYNDILFVCPRIDKQAYYYNIYKKFAKEFNGLNYTIAGKNPRKFDNNDSIIGYLEDDDFQQLFSSHKVLFYHSVEERHIHYPPFEAIASGMPVIFMKGGMLEKLLYSEGDILPGMCNSYKEARNKLKQICNGDLEFINQVLNSQKKLLTELDFEYCKKIWGENLCTLIPEYNQPKFSRITRKLGVILSYAYKGGVLTQLKNILRMLDKEIIANNMQIEIIVYFPRTDDLYYKNEFNDISLRSVTIREFYWKEVDYIMAQEIIKLSLKEIKLPNSINGQYCYPEDDVSSLTELDYWLIVSDRIPQQILPLKKYGIIAYDYLQRYSDFMDKNWQNIIINNARNADSIFVTTPQTLEDAATYATIPRYRLNLLPMEFSVFNDCSKSTTNGTCDNYFIWITNLALHKNHSIIAQALGYYYNILGGNLYCYISGVDSEIFSDKKKFRKNAKKSKLLPHVQYFKEVCVSSKISAKLKFFGYASDSEYVELLKNAKFLFHGNQYDNGSFALIESAYYGVPAVSTRYPATEFINNRFNLNLLFCSGSDYKDMALQLKKMEDNYEGYKAKLPNIKSLTEFSWENVSSEYFNNLMDSILI